MIGHQNIGMHGSAIFIGRLVQPLEILTTVIVSEETGLAIIAALNEMLRNACPLGRYAVGAPSMSLELRQSRQANQMWVVAKLIYWACLQRNVL
jgi:hypothetical protein